MLWGLLIAIVLTILVLVLAMNMSSGKEMSAVSYIVLVAGFFVLFIFSTQLVKSITGRMTLSENVDGITFAINDVLNSYFSDQKEGISNHQFDYKQATVIYMLLKDASTVPLKGLSISDIAGQTVETLPTIVGKELAEGYKNRIIIYAVLIVLFTSIICILTSAFMNGNSRRKSGYASQHNTGGYSTNRKYEDF